ncbi:hypothetical protein [Streptomyces goshikiensis]|uniref:hypothetical protein n=1 Tax=Streptomyces goshikiensis TaxID=1942 RepID=UPI0036951197
MRFVVEVVPPGPVYVLIDDYDDGGTVTVLSRPDREKAIYGDEVRAAYGAAVTVPEGPAKGFVIGEDITGAGQPRRGWSREKTDPASFEFERSRVVSHSRTRGGAVSGRSPGS